MSKIQEMKPGVEDYYRSQTDLSVKHFFSTWIITNFPLVTQFPKHSTHSGAFLVTQSPFELILKAASNNNNDKSIIIQLCKLKKDGKSYYFKYKMNLVNSKSDNICSREDYCSFDDETLEGNILTFNSNDVESSLQNDELIIRCEIMIFLQDTQTVDKSVSCAEYRKTLFPLKSQRARKKLYEEVLCLAAALTLACMFFCIIVLFNHCYVANNLKITEYGNEVNKLIFDSATKLMYIGEVLNMSDIKMNAYDFLSSYKMLNITNFETGLPIMNDSL